MVDRVYFTQELLKLFSIKNKMIEVLVGDLVELVRDEDLTDFMMDVCSDSESLATYGGMNFKIVAHYAVPYVTKTYSKKIEDALEVIGQKRYECMVNNTPSLENMMPVQKEDTTNYDVFFSNGVLLASSDEIKNSLYNGTVFTGVISKRVVQHELKDNKIVAFLN